MTASPTMTREVHPNVVDPNTFFDTTGNLWMVYGSYSGGIFILAMDETTGLPESGQGYGQHLMGGNHARIEGAYVIHNPQTGFYYLFTSFGGLAANGGVQHPRSAFAGARTGPTSMPPARTWRPCAATAAVIFDGTRIAPHGQKLVGNFQYSLATGESGTARRLRLARSQLGVLRRGPRQVLHPLPHALPGAAASSMRSACTS